MIRVTDEVIQQMVNAIVREVDPEQVYLFGSHARGEAREDSDVDFLIVESEPFGPNRKRLAELSRLRQALSEFFTPKDLLVYSRDEIARWRDSLNHIIGVCIREGRLLYDRP